MFFQERKYFKKLKGYHLTPLERKSLKDAITSFIQQDPLKDETVGRHVLQVPKKYSLLQFASKPIMVALMIILFVVLGGSLTYAAEGALPGDFLYPTKVHINESVWAALLVSDRAKSQWAVRRVERRLEEAEKLAVQGKLDSNTSAVIDKNLEVQAKVIHKNAEKLNSEGKADTAAMVSSDLEASLTAHNKILKKLTATTGSSIKAETLLESVSTETVETSQIRSKSEVKMANQENIKNQHAAQGSKKSALKKIEEVKKFLNKWKVRMGTEAVQEAEAKLQSAQTVFLEGDALLQAENFSASFRLFQKAHRIAQEAKLLLEARKKFGVDIGLNGTTTIKIMPEKKDKDNTLDIDEVKEKIDGLEKKKLEGDKGGRQKSDEDVRETENGDKKDEKDKEKKDRLDIDINTNINQDIYFNINLNEDRKEGGNRGKKKGMIEFEL